MPAEVSIITTIYNGEKWLNQYFESVYTQTYHGLLELSIYNDGSTDNSKSIIESWTTKLKTRDINLILFGHTGLPRGVGHGKNVAVRQSSGKYLCFLDADDEMNECRIEKQLQAAKSFPNTIVGCRFHRLPADSTRRYTQWANNLSHKQLYTQAYTSHGPTVVMPTWFCRRAIFDNVGGFDEGGKGVPEDLIFFYNHLEIGGELYRLDADLMMYRYHTDATTFSVDRKTIWMLRIEFLEKQVLSHWREFTIWNAGKQGRRFFRSLSTENQKKVCMFCDVDTRKINKGSYIYENSQEIPKPRVPIFHFTQAKTPIIICVKLDLTDGVFEENLKSLKLIEGVDYFHFN
ncbi:hypothetical protein LOTGIDRAFT_220159 [Lottia gigantea]|uniref:Glycosyltransferase 2-like domain-containing protein n=1 Tax=Lottia gigantea TaxID=225164 RepID=V3Z979_LOTGI|nr:hypothetical protein LOTGIDRAFT_220159 [Lottia gigantea]ESO87448.1 hypothetical protein LOTGIDRAFT_220159 [Lottia gigantea]